MVVSFTGTALQMPVSLVFIGDRSRLHSKPLDEGNRLLSSTTHIRSVWGIAVSIKNVNRLPFTTFALALATFPLWGQRPQEQKLANRNSKSVQNEVRV
jgi:hypothetical protein